MPIAPQCSNAAPHFPHCPQLPRAHVPRWKPGAANAAADNEIGCPVMGRANGDLNAPPIREDLSMLNTMQETTKLRGNSGWLR